LDSQKLEKKEQKLRKKIVKPIIVSLKISAMNNSNKKPNPNTKFFGPPIKKQDQEHPGIEKKLKPQADHGEKSYVGYNRFKNKSVIITGGDSGIGKAIAIAFAREGADVLISYLADIEEEDANDTAKWIEKAGKKAVLVKGDIGDEKHCKSIIKAALDNFGKIDVLINNAAFQMGRKTIEEIPSEEWQKTFDTNITAMFYLCKAAIKHMKPGSSIINTTSVNAYDPSEDLLAYAATKSAIQNFTANLSQILLKQKLGIRVNAVAPGPIWTPLIPSTRDNYKYFGKNTAMQRPGQPVEVAPAYLFLASEEASYISGATLPVTGGRITI
jgi:NAD(P)-dependent dehydrogenase (short-subunit alcohol dehydrogenase family)